MELEHEYLRNARRKARGKRGYFDDDDNDESFFDEEDESGSLGPSSAGSAAANGPAEAEIDPLDAFMAGITAQVSQEKAVTHTAKRPIEKPLRFDDEDDSYQEEMARTHKKAKSVATEYADSDEEVYATAKQVDGNSDDDDATGRKTIEALAPLEHRAIEYESFRKRFYTPHPAIAALSEADVRQLRRELSIATDGNDVPRPIRSFVEVGFDRKMLGMLMKLGLEAPTPIQTQAFPIAMSGRDMIGIAKTGSGKTLAFTLPMVVHVMDQRELRKDEGPIAIVLSPTRELAHQIFGQAKKFLNVYGAQCAAIYGGVGKWDQIQALRKGAEVVVATPGRLIDMIRKKNVKTKRVTFVVLDEADRMFEMGFEPQLRSIMGQIRPDRQTLMFSATFRKRVELLARDVLNDPVKITIGQIGQANEEIKQIAVVVQNHNAKWPWLMANLKRIAAEGRVLIFAGSKTGCEEMTKNLNALQYQSNCLHGDKNQQERNEALANFRSGACPILVATDVASRGLDVKDVKTVINYDVAKNIDTHVHRIGRTGRMGAEGFETGTAYTLVTRNDSPFAAQLVYNMDVSGQQVAGDLVAIAKKDPRFRRGTPAKGADACFVSAADSAAGGPRRNQPPSAFQAVDDEDEAEMKRWSDNQRKSKADQRKGLGFGASSGPTSKFQMSFVKSSAGSVPQSFTGGFVKATTASEPGAPAPVAPAPRRVPPQTAAIPTPPAPTDISMMPPPPPQRAPPLAPQIIGSVVPPPSHMLRPPPPGPPPPGPPPRPPFGTSAPLLPPHIAQLQRPQRPEMVTNSTTQASLPAQPSVELNATPTANISREVAVDRERERRGRSPNDSKERSSRRHDRRSRSRSRSSRDRGPSRRHQSRSRSRSRSYDRHVYRRRRSPSRSRSRSRGRYRR